MDTMQTGRSAAFEKPADLETAIAELNSAIQPGGTAPYGTPRKPVVLIVGCPRSGTTLMLQWLARLGCFAYPSNLLARFYANPWIGALAQRALVDLDRSGQIGITREIDFNSNLGRTQGALAPSEFWYFWRHHLGNHEIAPLSEQALSAVDLAGLLRGMAGLEAAFDMPVAMKGMMLNWNLPWVDRLLDRVLFVQMQRPNEEIAGSLLRSRQRFFGTTSRWYSFKPPEYTWLRQLSPEEQVAGQVIFTNRAVALGLEAVADARKLSVPLESLVSQPDAIYEQLRSKFLQQGYALPEHHPHVELGPGRTDTTSADFDLDRLRKALKRFERR